MFEEVARANNWSPRAKLDILPIYLQEGYSSRTWFRQNRDQWESVASGGSADAAEAGFEVFREAFLSQFGEEKKGWRKAETSCIAWILIASLFFSVLSLVIVIAF